MWLDPFSMFLRLCRFIFQFLSIYTHSENVQSAFPVTRHWRHLRSGSAGRRLAGSDAVGFILPPTTLQTNNRSNVDQMASEKSKRDVF